MIIITKASITEPELDHFPARLVTHIPNKHQVMTATTGGTRTGPAAAASAATETVGRTVAADHEVDPLIGPACGGAMRVRAVM